VPGSGANAVGRMQSAMKGHATSSTRQSDLLAHAARESDIWSDRLLAAFADANLHSGFLPLAEQAIDVYSGDPTSGSHYLPLADATAGRAS
jgi:hypothetical protein